MARELVPDQYLGGKSRHNSLSIFEEFTMCNNRLLKAFPLVLLLGVAQVSAANSGDWMIRGGVTNVVPDDSSSNVSVAGADLGVGVSVGNSAQLGLNFVYFYADNWAVELLAATPFDHDIDLDGAGRLADSKQLPPTLSLLYYPSVGSSQWHPYLGVGLNYTVFFDEEFTPANQQAGFQDLSLDDSLGLSVQAGFDYDLNEQWGINASVRWADIDTEASFILGEAAGAVDVDIDPFIYTLALSYRF